MRKLLLLLVLPLVLGVSNLPFISGCSSLNKDGGILKSVDGGAVWQEKNQLGEKGSIASTDITGIFFDPSDHKSVYLTTRGKGVFKSSNGGDLWQNTIVGDGNVYKITFNPVNRNIIYIAGFINSMGVVYKTEDSGKTWTDIYTDPLKQYAIFDVVVDHFNSDIIYVVTGWGGVLKSIDAGSSWTKVQEIGTVPQKIFMDPADSRRLWISTFDKGVWYTSDAGETWQEIVLAGLGEYTTTINQLVIDPEDTDRFYAATDAGLFFSEDGGQSWLKIEELTPEGSLPVLSVAFNPENKTEIFYATTSTLFRSKNFGDSWQTTPVMSGRKVRQIVFDPIDRNVIYLGLRQ